MKIKRLTTFVWVNTAEILLFALLAAYFTLTMTSKSYWGELIWSFYPYWAFSMLALCLIIAAACTIKRKLVKSIVSWLVLGFLVISVSNDSWLYRSAQTAAHQTNLRVYSANVLWSNTTQSDVIQQITQHDPDIVVIIEYYSKNHSELQAFLQEKYQFSSQDDQSQGYQFGNIVFSKRPVYLEPVVGRYRGYTPVRVMYADVAIDLFAVHTTAPTSKYYFQQRNSQLSFIADDINASDANYVVAIGDYNVTPYSGYMRRMFTRNLRSEFKLVSAKNGRVFTWQSPIPGVKAHIDHAITNAAAGKVRYFDIEGSDHKSMLIDLQINGLL